ncbi:hypothetical protein FEK35_23245 [Nocardia cyriacigeorgica]|uniref:Uncharacterized protein n=1 Tax=Nocardia cyriacigeorgica TaxID=135487 RepID=A0A5R8P8F3_9NOCA|nr:hypothetical protein [Nocardia cyriacigeorgica]TLG01778.1 hypothetical protein FEK35_23245 [Nocardia cyriacigeorgica]
MPQNTITIEQLCAAFDVEPDIVEEPNFPEPVGGGDLWDGHAVWTWMVAQSNADWRRRAEAAPLHLWPTPEPGAVHYMNLSTRRIAGALTQDWSVGSGVRVRVVWPIAGTMVNKPHPAERGQPVRQVLRVGNWAPSSPLPTLQRLNVEGHPDGAVSWSDLARILGGKVPYWPTRLRIPDVMVAWDPESGPHAPVAAHPRIDLAPIAGLAAVLATEPAACRVLHHLIHTAMHRASRDAAAEAKRLARPPAAEVLEVAVPALDVPGPPPLSDGESIAGWAEIMRRTDNLAHAAVRAACDYDVPRPYEQITDLDASDVTAQWARQLVPVHPLPAAFTAITPQTNYDPVDHLVDPATGIPVIRHTSGGMRIGVPHQLPKHAPLAAIVFDQHEIWIRTDDNSLYPAPRAVWHYYGYGPSSDCKMTAVLIEHLLDDISTSAVTLTSRTAPTPSQGLVELLSQQWPDGSTITRAELDNARTAIRS